MMYRKLKKYTLQIDLFLLENSYYVNPHIVKFGMYQYLS